jgi:four helix bundle protein
MMNDELKRKDLRERTKGFALRIIRLCAKLPPGRTGDIIARQVLRSGTSVGAQYREACRARSPSEFISKLHSALQELDETHYWLELIVESGLTKESQMAPLQKEASELLAIFTASILTARKNLARPKS